MGKRGDTHTEPTLFQKKMHAGEGPRCVRNQIEGEMGGHEWVHIPNNPPFQTTMGVTGLGGQVRGVFVSK